MTLLIVGDSNTFGYRPGGGRYLPGDRWTDQVKQALPAEKVRVEGQNGRVFFGRLCGLQGLADGSSVLRRTYAALQPETVLVQLGTNDLLSGVGVTVLADAMAAFLAPLAEQTRVIVLLPHAVDPLAGDLAFGPPWMVHACRALAEQLRAREDLARVRWVEVSDAGIDPFDGLHLSLDGHRETARKVLEAMDVQG